MPESQGGKKSLVAVVVGLLDASCHRVPQAAAVDAEKQL